MTDKNGKDNNNEESLLKFPCEFTLKVFGERSADFEQEIYQLLQPHVPNLSNNAFQSRTSENGKYLSLSITIYAESREQLDNIYKALTACPKVLMAL